MARFLHHSYPGRKAVLFLLEQVAVLPAALLGAALVAAIVAGDAHAPGGSPPLGRLAQALSQGPEAAAAALSALFAALSAGAALRLPAAIPWALGATLACAAALYAADLYNLRHASEDRIAGGKRTLVAMGLASIALLVASAPASAQARGAAVGAALAAALAVVALRVALPAIVGEPTRVLVVGTGAAAFAPARAIDGDAEANLSFAGFVHPGPGAAPLPARYLVDASKGLVEAARAAEATWIVAAAEDGRGSLPTEELVRCRLAGLTCLTPAMLYERALRRIPVDGLRPSELAFAEGFELSPARDLGKRCLDVAASLLGLVLAAPVLALAALAVKLDSRGPLFYRQERVGRHGRPFWITKLRTMRVDAEADGRPQWAGKRDPRITRVGRLLRLTRVDEIPQILSVLKGDMSFVGPRPERAFFVEQLEQQIPYFGLRQAVRPGLTGWAQLRYPYGASVEDAKAKLEYDLYYIKNGSLFLDLAILFHTVRHVLLARGAR